jgi:hypothetical protein
MYLMNRNFTMQVPDFSFLWAPHTTDKIQANMYVHDLFQNFLELRSMKFC